MLRAMPLLCPTPPPVLRPQDLAQAVLHNQVNVVIHLPHLTLLPQQIFRVVVVVVVVVVDVVVATMRRRQCHYYALTGYGVHGGNTMTLTLTLLMPGGGDIIKK